MQCILGNYDEVTVAHLGHLSVRLKGDKPNLSWTLCNLTAQFTAHYFANFFLRGEGGPNQQRLILEHTHSVRYVMNELMENAVKFRISGDIGIKAGMLTDQFCCSVSNIASKHNAEKLQALLEEITSGDVQNLLLQRFETNAMDSNSASSGLGFLTIINDYGAIFGCKIEACRDQPEQALVDTLITLPILNG
jgi:hypothetical protein